MGTIGLWKTAGFGRTKTEKQLYRIYRIVFAAFLSLSNEVFPAQKITLIRYKQVFMLRVTLSKRQKKL
jgi:hypothetical protein